MGDTFKRGTAVIVLVTFLLVIIAPDYSFGEGVVDTKEFEDAKIAYENDDYDSAIKLFNSFIEKFEGKNQFKDELKASYYYKAKIHFFGKEETEFITALTKLFELDLNYNLPKDEDLSFLQKAKDIQDAIRKRLDELKKLSEAQAGTSRIIYSQVETKKPKKKIRWVWVAVGAVAAGVILYLLLKPKKRTLTVTFGEGVEGSPASGAHIYKKGAAVKCNYSLKQGYTGLSLKLDGNEVQNGYGYEFKMYSNHTLEVTARQCTLTVIKGAGINGTPDSGTYTYQNGDIVSYNYTLQANYTDIVVTSDDVPVSPEGTITMNGPHTLKASATRQYTLNVTRGPGVNGTPITGSYTYKVGDVVSYSYSLQTGYKDLAVTLDGLTVPTTGSITMNANRTLAVSAKQYKLTVTRGGGVSGYPGTGNYCYNNGATVNYNYSLQTGYKDLVVRLNGVTVYKSGSITMNRDHALTASAVEIDDPPTVSITNPKNGDTITGPIFVKVDTSDDHGVAKVEFYIDDVFKRSISQTSYQYQWIWTTTEYTNGTHTIKVIAYDTANQTASHEITVTVSN